MRQFAVQPVQEQDIPAYGDLDLPEQYEGPASGMTIDQAIETKGACQQMLTMRMIGVRDYSVLEDGQRIGRIRFASERSPGVWLWHIQVHIPGPPFGSAKSLGDADASSACFANPVRPHGRGQ